MDLTDDWAYFDQCDLIDNVAKECYVEGVLTKKQWEKLTMRYRIV